MELKILEALYLFGFQKNRQLSFLFEEISHESVRIYYHRLNVLLQPKKKERRLVAIDETKLKLEEKRLIFVWAAIDYEGVFSYMGF